MYVACVPSGASIGSHGNGAPGSVLLYHWYVAVPVPSWYVTFSGGVTPPIHRESPTGCVVMLGPGVTIISTGSETLAHPDIGCVIST